MTQIIMHKNIWMMLSQTIAGVRSSSWTRMVIYIYETSNTTYTHKVQYEYVKKKMKEEDT